jgi:hypothetical protein
MGDGGEGQAEPAGLRVGWGGTRCEVEWGEGDPLSFVSLCNGGAGWSVATFPAGTILAFVQGC